MKRFTEKENQKQPVYIDAGNSGRTGGKLNKLKKRLENDDRGAAMVMVLVIIMFIAILAAVLMFVAYLGYQMRLMDKQGKDAFYDAETVLDEINIGLQAEASAAMSEAYNEVMKNYAVYDNTAARSSEFYKNYINTLKDSLQGSGADGTYDITKFRSWLSDKSFGNSTGDIADGTRGSRGSFGTYGAIVESNVTPEAYMLIKNEGESLLIKDLKVTYVDEAGYVSIISTDIRLALPEVSFAQSSELPRLEKFSMIADETLAMGNTGSGNGVTIKGNAYAGRIIIGRPDANDADKDKYPSSASSFISGSRAGFESVAAGEENMSLVISRENIVVEEGALTTSNAELWGRNINLSSSDLDLDGITNLKDDLILEGKNSTAKLSGEYNGFSMISDSSSGGSSGAGTDGSGSSGAGTEGSGTPGTDGDEDASLSSAIIVNGQDSRLDFSGLESMTIAGRSYVQTRTKASESGTASYTNKSNVMMAESVSVKSNQLIYLAPAEAVGCVIENDGSIGDTAFGANPLTLEQYEKITANPDKYLLLDANRNIAALGYKPLNNYISQETIAGQTEKAYVPEVIFKQSSTGTLVYCYLRFTDEEKANQYFIDYYNVNSTQVDKYTRLYAKEIKMPDPSAMLYLNLAGNMLVYNDGEASSSVISAPDNGKSGYYIKRKQAKTAYNTKTNAFKALSAKLVTDITQLTPVEQGRTAFENVINRTKFNDLLSAAGTSSLKIETGGVGEVKTAVLVRGNYTIDASTPDNSIVICTGDVTVARNFKGLIIAGKSDDGLSGGNVIIASGGAGLTIEPMDIKDFSLLLDASLELGGIGGADPTTYYVLDLFRDGVNYKQNSGASSSSSSQTDGSGAANLKDLIVYEQWSKR